MLTKCLAACAHLSITVSEIERDICEQIVIFSYPLAFDARLGGFPSEYRHRVWYAKKLEWWGYPTVKKLRICVTVYAQYRRVTDTDRETDGHLATAYMHTRRAVKTRTDT